MRNPFTQKMPIGMDIRIRVRLARTWLAEHAVIGLGALAVPALAVWLFLVVTPVSDMPDSTTLLVAEIRAMQLQERTKAEQNIYHVTREISEGSGKAAYVAEVLGATVVAPARADRIETYQHSDTALALIESNGTERAFEVFLSRAHEDGQLSLHHYGPKTQAVPDGRAAYDTAHDLASLYTDFTSLERPNIPILAAEAAFVEIDEDTNRAQFRTVLTEAITVDSYVDLDSKLVVEEVIYVQGGDASYEMTRISYLEREVIPAEQFEVIFNPNQYDYEVIATRAQPDQV